MNANALSVRVVEYSGEIAVYVGDKCAKSFCGNGYKEDRRRAEQYAKRLDGKDHSKDHKKQEDK